MKGKKIVFLFQYFRHPGEPGGTRIYWIAKEFVEAGYSVTVITQKNSFNPENKDAKSLERVIIDGINIVYIKNAYSNDFSYPKRFYCFFKFMIKSTWYALKEKDVSLVVATSTPLSIGFPAMVLKIFKRIPFAFEIRDLWPEVPIQMGVIKNKFLQKVFRKFESILYKNAEHVFALSPGMAEGVYKHIPKEDVTVISNMAKIDKFWPREKNTNLANELGLTPNSFKIIHFGTMGVANGLDNFINTALLCKNKGITDIEFIIVGSGKMKEPFRKKKQENNLDNFHIFDRMPMTKISELVNLCDISYVGFSPFPILETNSANKFFDSLSAGKPIIINYGGWMKEIIEEVKCGIRVDAVDPSDLLDKILYIKSNPEIMKEMGENSRKLAEEQFDKSILCPKYVKVIDEVLVKIDKRK